MQYKCEITTQRKTKALQPLSDEQMPWTEANLQQDVRDSGGAHNTRSEPANGNENRATADGMERSENTETVNGSGAQTEWSQSPMPENIMDRTDGPNQAREDPRVFAEIRQQAPPSRPSLAPQTSPWAQRMTSSDIPSPEEDRMQRIIPSDRNRFAPPMRAVPSRRAGDVLVDRFFSEVNELHFILSYNDFMPWYQRWFPEIILDPTKQATLFTVFAFGCKDDINAPADSYFIHAVNAMGPVLVNGCLEAVQALTLGVFNSSQIFYLTVIRVYMRYTIREPWPLGHMWGRQSVWHRVSGYIKITTFLRRTTGICGVECGGLCMIWRGNTTPRCG
jgi:hypothetical protein